MLWKSLPGRQDSLRLELYNKREISDERLAKIYDHDAVVAGFLMIPRDVGGRGPAPAPTSALFLQLQAILSSDTTQELALGIEMYASFSIESGSSREEPRTSLAYLAEDEVSSPVKFVSWNDEIKLPLACTQERSWDKEYDHIFVHVYAILNTSNGDKSHVLIGGCPISIRQLVDTLESSPKEHDSDNSIEVEERLVCAGSMRGWLRTKISVTRETEDSWVQRAAASEGHHTQLRENNAASDGSTTKPRASSLRAVSKGLRSIVFGRKKK